MKKQQIQYRAFVSPEEVAQWVAQCYTPKELMELSVLINSDSPLADYKGGLYRVVNQYLRLHCETYQSDYDIVGLQKLLLSRRGFANLLLHLGSSASKNCGHSGGIHVSVKSTNIHRF